MNKYNQHYKYRIYRNHRQESTLASTRDLIINVNPTEEHAKLTAVCDPSIYGRV